MSGSENISRVARGWRCSRSQSSLRCRSGISTGSPQQRPAIVTGLTQADLDYAKAAHGAGTEAVQKQQRPIPSTDQQPADACAICAVISLAGNVLFATPPLLQLPHAVELLYLTTDAEFAHLNSVHPAFQSRAPPAS